MFHKVPPYQASSQTTVTGPFLLKYSVYILVPALAQPGSVPLLGVSLPWKVIWPSSFAPPTVTSSAFPGLPASLAMTFLTLARSPSPSSK